MNNKNLTPNLKSECKLCDFNSMDEHTSTIKSTRAFYKHLMDEHNLTFEEYYIQEYCGDAIPECKCGCGTKMQFDKRYDPPYKEYARNHFPRKPHTEEVKSKIKKKSIAAVREKYGVDNPFQSEEVKSKIRKTNLERYGVDNPMKVHDIKERNRHPHTQETKDRIRQTNIKKYGAPSYTASDEGKEHIKRTMIERYNIENTMQYPEFVEKQKKTNLEMYGVESLLTDRVFRKKYQYHTDYMIDYRSVIIPKEYFKGRTERQLMSDSKLILKFIRAFQPKLPQFTHPEVLDDILVKLPTKVKGVKNDNIYSNNCSNIGVGFLKQRFRSYWKSSYNGNKTPEEIWEDDEMMLKVIQYRIGLNNSGEVYDLSLHNLIRGISAIRGTISFFKPLLAAAIYKDYLGDSERPLVIDPCAGFGGRMLGFKSMYPNGIYIGIEPNVETFNELVKLSKNFNDVILINSVFEEVDLSEYEYDMMFTSIPYFDKEIYSNTIDYDSYGGWVNTFIDAFNKYDNVILNIPESLSDVFKNIKKTNYVQHNASHLSKKNSKTELIIYL